MGLSRPASIRPRKRGVDTRGGGERGAADARVLAQADRSSARTRWRWPGPADGGLERRAVIAPLQRSRTCLALCYRCPWTPSRWDRRPERPTGLPVQSRAPIPAWTPPRFTAPLDSQSRDPVGAALLGTGSPARPPRGEPCGRTPATNTLGATPGEIALRSGGCALERSTAILRGPVAWRAAGVGSLGLLPGPQPQRRCRRRDDRWTPRQRAPARPRSPAYPSSTFFARSCSALRAFLASSLPAPGGRTEERGGTAAARRRPPRTEGTLAGWRGSLHVREVAGPAGRRGTRTR